MDGTAMNDADGVFTEFYEKFKLPDYFGWNWAAQHDLRVDGLVVLPTAPARSRCDRCREGRSPGHRRRCGSPPGSIPPVVGRPTCGEHAISRGNAPEDVGAGGYGAAATGRCAEEGPWEPRPVCWCMPTAMCRTCCGRWKRQIRSGRSP
ncbi:barstar family protein [Streptomyces sp. NPDC056672]|uniref:barstar family protein n=1 Tax=Streptomyces sp. NPDC056672 TaxID=3345906 RepID=UPI0036C7ABD7